MFNDKTTFNVEISPGELLDKYSILAIKADRINDPKRLFFVLNEIDVLKSCVQKIYDSFESTSSLFEKLLDVNKQLWDVEDALRNKEAKKVFDEEFIELARNVYQFNDQRAAIKLEINNMFNCSIAEQKQHPSYTV